MNIIEGVQGIVLTINTDHRGSLIELFRNDILQNYINNVIPSMGYLSMTNPGYERGPHEHKEQTDIFVFVGPGTFELWLWDNRKDSSTYTNNIIIECGIYNPMLWIVPPGVVHGYKNISHNIGMVLNFPDKLYKGIGKLEEVDEIRHELNENTPYIMKR